MGKDGGFLTPKAIGNRCSSTPEQDSPPFFFLLHLPSVSPPSAHTCPFLSLALLACPLQDQSQGAHEAQVVLPAVREGLPG